MKKLVLVFGLISGVLVSLLLVVNMALWEAGTITFDNGEYFGYAGMVIAFSMIFFGIKSYRDNYRQGNITFQQGLKIGLLITLVASVMYVLAWEVYYQAKPEIRETFMDKYTEHAIAKMQEKGASAEDLERTRREMNEMAKMYQNPLVRFGMTLLEIVPVGIILTLLSAAFLKRKEFLPTQN